MAERQQAKYFLLGPAFPCTLIQQNPSGDSLHICNHNKDSFFNLRPGIHQGARAWAANRRVANGSNAQLTDATERTDANFPTSCSSSATLPTETICMDRFPLLRSVTQLSRSRIYTDNVSDNKSICRADVNSWLVDAWHAMRSTLASVTMTSASTPHAQHHSIHDSRFPDSTFVRGAAGNNDMTCSGAISDPAAGVPCNSSPVSSTDSTVMSNRQFGLLGSVDGGQGGGRGGADGGSDGGGAGWAAGQQSRGAPHALFSLARADAADRRRVRGHRGWDEDAVNGTGGRGGGIGAAGMSAGIGGDLDLAKAEAVLADLMRDGRGGGGGGGGEAVLDSGDVADPGRAAEAEAVLSRLECGFCHRRLSSRRRSRAVSAATLLCDGCHRGFHTDCCRYRGRDTRPRQRWQVAEGSGEDAIRVRDAGDDAHSGGGEVWYHSKDCSECAAQWQRRAAAGPLPAPGGRTWLLAASELYGLKGAARQEALEALQQASAVLSAEYGPRVVDAVLDSDYAVVLRDARGTAVSAATVDVYGREVVVMDLAATSDDARGRGHFRALVTSLESWLDETTTQHWVVTLAPVKDGKAALRMWREHGFRPLPARQAHAWARQLPGFPDASGGGAVLLERRMAAGERR
ncbi:hypothetical protein Vafri_12013, partial [Volvox africanus]